MVQLDPTKIQVQSNAAPIWEQEETFQEMMAERLRKAPYLFISAGFHVVIALLVIALMPPEEKKDQSAVVEMQMNDCLLYTSDAADEV